MCRITFFFMFWLFHSISHRPQHYRNQIFWDILWFCVILHFYRIFNRIDQSESTAKILDLVPVHHWTDHKTNIVAASFQLLKKNGAKHFQNFLMVFGDRIKGARNTTWLKGSPESIFERKFRKNISKPSSLKCNLPYKPFKPPRNPLKVPQIAHH